MQYISCKKVKDITHNSNGKFDVILFDGNSFEISFYYLNGTMYLDENNECVDTNFSTLGFEL